MHQFNSCAHELENQRRVGAAQMRMQEPDDVDLAVSTLKTAVVGLQAAKEHKKPLATYIHLVESALDMVKAADA